MIQKIALKNFKCFENLSLSFGLVNVLTGLNGMGKSTVIQSLLLLKQSYDGSTNKDLLLNGAFANLGWGSDILYEKAADDYVGISVQTDTFTCKLLYDYIADSNSLPFSGDELPSKKLSDLSKRLYYLSAFRISPQNFYPLTSKEFLSMRQFGNAGEFSLQYLDLFSSSTVENKHMLLGSADNNGLLNQVGQWISYISPGAGVHVNVDEKIKTAELRYNFIEGNEKTNDYRCINVGFGLTYVLPIIVLLLSAKPGDTIMIENPEAHIHPAGQSKLGELIARAGADGIQVIVETHSDHILNGIRLAVKSKIVPENDVDLFYFYKDKEDGYKHKVVCPHIESDGQLDNWPEGFFDEWDNMLLKLL